MSCARIHQQTKKNRKEKLIKNTNQILTKQTKIDCLVDCGGKQDLKQENGEEKTLHH